MSEIKNLSNQSILASLQNEIGKKGVVYFRDNNFYRVLNHNTLGESTDNQMIFAFGDDSLDILESLIKGDDTIDHIFKLDNNSISSNSSNELFFATPNIAKHYYDIITQNTKEMIVNMSVDDLSEIDEPEDIKFISVHDIVTSIQKTLGMIIVISHSSDGGYSIVEIEDKEELDIYKLFGNRSSEIRKTIVEMRKQKMYPHIVFEKLFIINKNTVVYKGNVSRTVITFSSPEWSAWYSTLLRKTII